MKNFKTKIISGEFKNIVLEIPNILTTRSSKTIIRESIFNTIQFDILNKNFVEVFAGSGSIGLEALSRGAKKSFFLEENKIVLKILIKNIRALDINRCFYLFGDSFKNFENILKMVNATETKTYFYFDPPFSTREGMKDIYIKTLELIKKIDKKNCEMIIIEHIKNNKIFDQIEGFSKLKSKTFGKTTLTYLTYNAYSHLKCE